MSTIDFMFYPIVMCFIPQTLFFSLFPSVTAKTCSGSLVLFGSSGQNIILTARIIITTLIKNAYLVMKTYNARKQHTGSERGGGENGYKAMYMED